jgi:hypothetical protein
MRPLQTQNHQKTNSHSVLGFWDRSRKKLVSPKDKERQMVRKTRSKEETQTPRSVEPSAGIRLLERQMEGARQLLANRPIDRADHRAWRNTTRDYLIKTFGSESENIHAVINASSGLAARTGMSSAYYEEYEASRLENQIKMLQSCIEQLETEMELRKSVDSRKKVVLDSISELLRVIRKFHVVAKQLAKRHNNRRTLEIEDEYDVQDLLHGLLKIYFEDVRPEEWTPSYAGGSSRMDFLLKKEGIVVEVKKTRETLRDKAIGEELLVDIAKYKPHSDCRTLVCFVYDPEGRIGNPRGLENDLNMQSNGDLRIIAIVEPF